MAFVSDYIITDYSAVIYEVSELNKPIYLYAYDKETYIDKRDFYLDYDKDMPGEILTNVDDLLDRINNNKSRFSGDYKKALVPEEVAFEWRNNHK